MFISIIGISRIFVSFYILTNEKNYPLFLNPEFKYSKIYSQLSIISPFKYKINKKKK